MKLTAPPFLAVVAVQLVMTMTMGAVNIALPVIQTELSASNATITWLVALYQLGFALVLVLGGRLGDVHGPRRVLLLGLAGFTAANTLAVLAPNAEVLLAARLLQGVSGGIATPQVLAVIQRMFRGSQRTAAFGVFMTAGALGYMVGQLAAGGLMSADAFGLGWRWCVLFVTPLALCALATASVVLPTMEASERDQLDVVGVLIAGLVAVLILFPLIQGRANGWPMWMLAMLVASVPTVLAFVAHERRVERAGNAPLLRLELFRLRTFAVGNSLGVLVGLISFSVVVFATITLQSGFGLSPLETAFVTAPMPLANMVGATLTARLVARIGRSIFAYGAAMLALSVVALIAGLEWVGDQPRPGYLVPGLLLFGFSIGIPLAAGVAVTMSEVPDAHAGAASGVQQTVSQLTSSIGVALVGIVFYSSLADATTGADYVDALVVTLLATLVPCAALGIAFLMLPRALNEPPTVGSRPFGSRRTRRRAAEALP